MSNHWLVSPDERIDKKTGAKCWVLIQHDSIHSRSKGHLWWMAMDAPRKPMRFKTYEDARIFEETVILVD